MQKYLTCCGLYCGACHSMIIHEKQNACPDTEHLQIEESETACAGCNSMAVSQCEIKSCCADHHVLTCADCPDSPCEMTIHFSKDEWAHHIVVIENLSRIKSIGYDAWLSEQAKLWQCKECGARSIWYQEICQKCSAVLEPKGF